MTFLVWVLQGLRTSRRSKAAIAVPQSSRPQAPRPAALCKEDVLMHALRHLRYLMAERRNAWVAEMVGDRVSQSVFLIFSRWEKPSGPCAAEIGPR